MRHRLVAVGLSIGLMLLGQAPVSACSIMLRKFRKSPIDAQTWVVAGVVTGYVTAPDALEEVSRPAGLLVSIDAVVRPTGATGNVEVYRFARSGDCTPVAYSPQDLAESYPVGTRVQFVGRPVADPAALPNATPRFASLPEDFGSLSWAPPIAPEAGAASTWDGVLRDFELARSLVALEGELSEAAVVAILERIALGNRVNPRLDVSYFTTLVKKARLTEETQQRLIEQFQSAESPRVRKR